MKNSLLAAVSHELRTPLAVVLGLAQTLRLYDLRDDPQRMSDILEKIEDNARRLERLLLDLLDLDRLSRGVMEPLRRPAWLGSLVGRVVGAVELRGRLVEMEVDDEIAYVDVAEAERILENLLVNAIKHTPPDTRIWVRGQRVAGGTLLSVEDEGEGIPDEMKDKIFDPFHRGSTYATGTGIGLSLVAKFAELHGGRAWVEDRPGGGAAFRVLLPHEPGDETPSVESAKRSRPRPSVRGV
jgi:signal transduction histidine kinase